MLSGTYYAHNYASIIGGSLQMSYNLVNFLLTILKTIKVRRWSIFSNPVILYTVKPSIIGSVILVLRVNTLMRFHCIYFHKIFTTHASMSCYSRVYPWLLINELLHMTLLRTFLIFTKVISRYQTLTWLQYFGDSYKKLCRP